MKIHRKLFILVFLAILFGLPVTGFFLQKQQFSSMENRYLAEFPQITAKSYFEGSYFDALKTYSYDHFPFRNQFVKTKTNILYFTGQREINSVFLSDNTMIEHMKEPDAAVLQKNLDAISAFCEAYVSPEERKNINIMIVPTAEAIYPELVPRFVSTYNQKAMIDNFYASVSKNANVVDVFSSLAAAKQEYIYYRTDHHLTSLGSYYAYASFAQSRKITAKPKALFNIEHASYDFRGSLYSKTAFSFVKPDVVDFYHPVDTDDDYEVTVNSGGRETVYKSIYFREFLAGKDQYRAFLGQNEALISVKTNAGTGRSLLMIKDSYAHSLIPFFALHYDEIVLVDMRYINIPISKMADVNSFSDVLILYGTSTLCSDKNAVKLALTD